MRGCRVMIRKTIENDKRESWISCVRLDSRDRGRPRVRKELPQKEPQTIAQRHLGRRAGQPYENRPFR